MAMLDFWIIEIIVVWFFLNNYKLITLLNHDLDRNDD